MHIISDILADIERGCVANNMVEERFSYRIVFFVKDGYQSYKHYIDTAYGGLRESLENIIKSYLTLTNSIVIAAVTVRKDGKSVCLQSRSYGFSLDGYFRQIKRGSLKGSIIHDRYAAR